MEQEKKIVDGFRFLPPGLKAWIRTFIPEEDFKGYIPWTPLSKTIEQTIFSLVTSAGISLKTDPPFDMEREKREAVWGDRSFRAIPRQTTEKEIDCEPPPHQHQLYQTGHQCDPSSRRGWQSLNQRGSLDVWLRMPIHFTVFNGRAPNFLKEAMEPISKRMKAEGVEAVILTPA